MRITTLVLCDFAARYPGGKSTLVGTHRVFVVPELPYVMDEALFIYYEVEIYPRKLSTPLPDVTVRCLDPDGEELYNSRGSPEMRFDDGSLPHEELPEFMFGSGTLRIEKAKFEKNGLYRLVMAPETGGGEHDIAFLVAESED